MAVRGVVTTIEFYDEQFNLIDSMQNYFADGFDGTFGFSRYNYFSISPLSVSSDRLTSEFTIVFGGTSANKELVEKAIDERLFVFAIIERWSDNEGLENPERVNLFAFNVAHASAGSSNFTTVTLQCRTYGKTVNADYPGRKIPAQILSPLGLRRT